MHTEIITLSACTAWSKAATFLCRWPDGVATDYFKAHHWRKASQWFGLTRPHATLLGQETAIWPRYPAYCGTCIADEHYWGSALAAYGQADHTDCWGRLHYVNWDPGADHNHVVVET